jgi:hypothetical protein
MVTSVRALALGSMDGAMGKSVCGAAQAEILRLPHNVAGIMLDDEESSTSAWYHGLTSASVPTQPLCALARELLLH